MSAADTLYQQVRTHLDYLKLTAAAEALPGQLDSARDSGATHTEFLAALLGVVAKRGAFDQLVVVAPPQALGGPRAEFTEAVRGRVVEEINKDLVEATVEELTARLDEALVGTMLR